MIITQTEMIKKIIRVPAVGDFEFPFLSADEVLTDEECLAAVRAQVPNLPSNSRIDWDYEGKDENGLDVYAATLTTRAQTKGAN